VPELIGKKTRVLDLFCGSGGAGKGYADAGCEVVGVDSDPKRLALYPFEAHQGDALVYLLDHGHEFDIVHASPPCTGYSRGTAALPDRMTRYDRLIAVTREALRIVGKPYVIENVEDAGKELLAPMLLCWSMFFEAGSVVDDDGTPLQMQRHRLFESNMWLTPPATCNHVKGMQVAGAYGGARRNKDEARYIRKGGYVPPSLEVLRALLGTPWMDEKGCFLCIPPVYTEHIGAQILEQMALATAGESVVPVLH
jgi:DNA (cytosine-5)-methyltransferase 1